MMSMCLCVRFGVYVCVCEYVIDCACVTLFVCIFM